MSLCHQNVATLLTGLSRSEVWCRDVPGLRSGGLGTLSARVHPRGLPNAEVAVGSSNRWRSANYTRGTRHVLFRRNSAPTHLGSWENAGDGATGLLQELFNAAMPRYTSLQSDIVRKGRWRRLFVMKVSMGCRLLKACTYNATTCEGYSMDSNPYSGSPAWANHCSTPKLVTTIS